MPNSSQNSVKTHSQTSINYSLGYVHRLSRIEKNT